MTNVRSTLASLIRINSVNAFYDNGPGEGALAEYIQGFFADRNIHTWTQEVFPGRSNVIARLDGKQTDRRILLEAHMDTVSVSGMEIHPFDPKVENGCMFGRGACDTKAGLAAMMHAVSELRSEGFVPPCEVWLCAVVDEEYSFQGVLKLCQGSMASAAIVAEPTELRTVLACKGVLRWRIVSKGRAAHSSKVHLGNNAIHHMARLVVAIEDFHTSLLNRTHPLLGSATGNVGVIRGGHQVNFVPDLCSIEIDRRLLPTETVHSVLEEYQQILNRMHVEFPQSLFAMESPMLIDVGLSTDPNSDVARCAQRVAEKMGIDGQYYGVPFGCDASKLAAHGIPSIVFGPGSIDRAHAAIEYVELDQVDVAVDFIRRFILEFE